MAFAVLEYHAHRDGQPIEPPFLRTTAVAFGGAHVLNTKTTCAVVIPAADMRLRISSDGAAAAATDYKIVADDARCILVNENGASQLYGAAA